MTARTWIGGGDNSATDANDWSPVGIPQPADALSMITNAGTMNVSGGAISGATLTITGPAETVNLSNVTTAAIDLKNFQPGLQTNQPPRPAGVFNLSGRNHLSYASQASDATVNLAANAVWAGGFNLSVSSHGGASNFGSTLVINGAAGSSFENQGNSIVGDDVIINASITGHGNFTIQKGFPVTRAVLELAGSVSAGQTVTFVTFGGILQLDDPTHYSGSVVMNLPTVLGAGEDVVDLKTLSAASSYTYVNNLLTIYSGNSLIDRLNLTASGPIQVEKMGTDLYVVGASDTVSHGATLPTHVDPPTLPGVLPLGPPNNFLVADQTTGQTWQSQGQPYVGPVAGLTSDFVTNTSDILSVTAETPNVFIETGYIPVQQSQPSAASINVSQANGNNVLDSYAASDFYIGGTGNDTFFVDLRTLNQASWSTILNFHSGDTATVWGVTAADFQLNWIGDTFGAGGANNGLTGVFHPNAAGRPDIALTLAGHPTADLTNGAPSIAYGAVSGNNYVTIHAN